MMGSEPVDFEWLADLSRWQCFTTCELSRPAKSLDFGDEGFTASLTDWHELLQLTRPDSTCGVVFLRGRFPDNAASILSRAQRRDDGGSKGTFGTRLLQSHPDHPDVELGERKVQGWVNFRWPYTQYELVRRHPDTGAVLGTGTSESISFVSKGTVFQITRLKWGQGSSVSDYDAYSARGGGATARLHVGGSVRFGCPCSNTDPKTLHEDTYTISPTSSGFSCSSAKYRTRLEMGVWVNGKQLKSPHGATRSADGKWADLSSEHRIDLAVGESNYIVSTYVLRNDEEDTGRDVDTSLPPDLMDYLGVSRESANMSDRLWTALCATNYEAVEAVEFCIVGRCVEQILGVTSVPVRRPSRSRPKVPGMPETALIGNIMTYQYVDVQSMFFQIRVLVKLHFFIKTRKLEPDLLQPFCHLDRIRERYLERLEEAIRSSVTWLFMTDLKPIRLLLAVHSEVLEDDPEDTARNQRLDICIPQREAKFWDLSYNRGCYASMAGWLVFKTCPEVVTPRFIREVVLPNLPVAYEVGIDRDRRNRQPTSKSNVLHWLHFSCLLLLQDEVGWEENELPPGVNRQDLDLEQLYETQERFEKHVSRLKTSSADGWSVEHEELDRVLLLAEEMGLDRLKSKRSHSLAISRVRQTRKRIRERKRTTKFSTRPKHWMAARGLSNGPWELMCTNHEAYLRVASEVDVIPARDRLFEFLLADYSFMASWDRADANMVGRWWSIQPVAMICATLLDLKLEGKLQAAKAIDPSLENADDELAQSVPILRTDTVLVDSPSANVPTKSTAITEIALLQTIVQELRQSSEAGSSDNKTRAFDWITRRPTPTYYPAYATQSLDDTPDIYGQTQSKDVHLRRSLQHYLETHGARDLLETPGYTTSNVDCYITQEDLCLLNLFDIFQTNGFEFYSSRQRCSRPETSDGRASSTNSKTGNNGPQRGGTVSDYGAVLQSLNDSLVDVGSKHRILFAQKLSPALVGGLIYLWHPDALDSIDDHFGTMSRFTESREKSMWTTSITISHWAIRTVDEHRADPHRETHRQNGDFPPENILLLGYKSDQMHVVEERASTVVMTGHPDGYLWVCSVLSSSTDSEAIASVISKALPKVLSKFIHQQEIARCLAFLLLLGHLCEKLASEYNEVLAKLDEIMGIGDRTLLEGLEDWWGTVEAINKLKKMLWGWEALRVFNDRLSSSLSQIQRAQIAMENAVKHDALQQDIDLIQEYNSILDEFKKRQGMLVDVAEKTQLKIKQVTGLRDGISTITNVVDTQTALADNQTTIQQGNNIRTLTYITIAYLPLGFITGLFSIQHATFMDGATDWQFAVLIVLFSLGTYLLAFSLDRALVQFKGKLWPVAFRARRNPSPKDMEAIPLDTWLRRRDRGG